MLEIVNEIKRLIEEETDQNGIPQYDVDKVYLSLQFVKKELQTNMK